MYIIDDSNSELYIMGYYEIREKEFTDKDITHLDEPVISYGDWGWLCSYYSIVYDSKGNPVCLVGCDVDMNEIMHERYKFLALFITLIVGISIIIYIGAIYIIKKLIIKPLNQINNETQKFNPTDSNSTIIDLSLPNNEIGDIYKSIKTLETNITTYIDNLNQVENDNKIKDTQILKLTDKTYKDALTSVGNVNAYNQKIKDLYGTYALVMLDINNLKQINDKFGHKVGDEYIKGCCKLICNAFKHSPVYRIGGDEFIVILQKVDYDNRQYIIDKLTKTFDDLYNNTNIDLPYRYSMSIGMAISKPDMSVEDVYNLADKQMYNNKVLFKQVYGSYR
jgi:diguanylate cyclase (GGDEF)-like protein